MVIFSHYIKCLLFSGDIYIRRLNEEKKKNRCIEHMEISFWPRQEKETQNMTMKFSLEKMDAKLEKEQ